MSAGLLVVVLVVLVLGLVVPVVAALVAWAVLRPGDGEPPARARLRRGSGTAAAAATALAVVVVLPAAVLALGSPELAAVVVLLAGLLHVAVLWCGEALTARPRAATRTAPLGVEPRPPLRRALLAVLAGSTLGLLVLLAVSLVDAAGEVLPASPLVTLLTVVPAAVLVGVALLAARQVSRRAHDLRLHPEVDAAGRARAAHRLLRAGAAGACAALGLLLLGTELRVRATDGDAVATTALVLGGLLLVVAAIAALLPVPDLPLRPDSHPDPGGVLDPAAGAGLGGGG